MQMLRLPLVGMVTLALLGALGGASVAQDDAETAQSVSREVSVFDGTMPYPRRYLRGRTESILEEGKWLSRGDGWEVPFEDVSDPRLVGTYRNIVNKDTYLGRRGSDVSVGAQRIDSADGSWLGPVTGYRNPAGGAMVWHGVLEGTGAYEGLSAIVFMEGDHSTSSYMVHGVVFPGVPPEVPEYPEPAE